MRMRGVSPETKTIVIVDAGGKLDRNARVKQGHRPNSRRKFLEKDMSAKGLVMVGTWTC
jgi:hypothetical protein